MTSNPSVSTLGLRYGVKPNPKKDKAARRKRHTTITATLQKASADKVCANCKLRPRDHGSARCEQCKREYHEKNS